MGAISLLLLLAVRSLGSQPVGRELTPAQEASLPSWAREVIQRDARLKAYHLSAWINPFYQRGDFDGDGKMDAAILARHRKSGKRGILVLFRGGRSIQVLGAGRAMGNGGDDFDWMDSWQVRERKAGTGRKESLLLQRFESGGGEVWWDGRAFRWRQQGD